MYSATNSFATLVAGGMHKDAMFLLLALCLERFVLSPRLQFVSFRLLCAEMNS